MKLASFFVLFRESDLWWSEFVFNIQCLGEWMKGAPMIYRSWILATNNFISFDLMVDTLLLLSTASTVSFQFSKEVEQLGTR